MKFPEDKAQKVKTDTEYWNPENDGDEIVGIYTENFIREGGFGTTYILNDGEKRVGLPSHAFLQAGMSRVPLQSIVRVKRTGVGKAKKGQNPPVMYDIEFVPQ